MTLYAGQGKSYLGTQEILPSNNNRLANPQLLNISTQTSNKFGQIVKLQINFVCFTRDQFIQMFQSFLVLGSTVCIQYGWSNSTNNFVDLNANPNRLQSRINWNQTNDNLDTNYNCYYGYVVDFSFNITQKFTYQCMIQVHTKSGLIIFNDNRQTQLIKILPNSLLANYYYNTSIQFVINNQPIYLNLKSYLDLLSKIPPINYTIDMSSRDLQIYGTSDNQEWLIFGGVSAYINQSDNIVYVQFLQLLNRLINSAVFSTSSSYRLDISNLNRLKQCVSINLSSVIIS